MNQQDIREVELTIEEAKKIVAFGEAIRRLEKNKDYRAVFTDGYFLNEASRLTLLSGDPAITDQVRANVFVSLRSIGELNSYLRQQVQLADQMTVSIREAQELLDHMRAEEADAADEEA